MIMTNMNKTSGSLFKFLTPTRLKNVIHLTFLIHIVHTSSTRPSSWSFIHFNVQRSKVDKGFESLTMPSSSFNPAATPSYFLWVVCACRVGKIELKEAKKKRIRPLANNGRPWGCIVMRETISICTCGQAKARKRKAKQTKRERRGEKNSQMHKCIVHERASFMLSCEFYTRRRRLCAVGLNLT